MRNGLFLVCAASAVTLGCQKADLRELQKNEIETTEREYRAWAKSQPRPPQQLIDRVEKLLAKQRCIGPLDRWSRSYAYNYDIPDKALYKEVVDFYLEEAGAFGIKAGVHVTEPNSWVQVDDTPIRAASGDYDIAEDRIRIAWCGNNVGPPTSKTDIYDLDGYWDELKRRRLAYKSARPR